MDANHIIVMKVDPPLLRIQHHTGSAYGGGRRPQRLLRLRDLLVNKMTNGIICLDIEALLMKVTQAFFLKIQFAWKSSS